MRTGHMGWRTDRGRLGAVAGLVLLAMLAISPISVHAGQFTTVSIFNPAVQTPGQWLSTQQLKNKVQFPSWAYEIYYTIDGKSVKITSESDLEDNSIIINDPLGMPAYDSKYHISGPATYVLGSPIDTTFSMKAQNFEIGDFNVVFIVKNTGSNSQPFFRAVTVTIDKGLFWAEGGDTTDTTGMEVTNLIVNKNGRVYANSGSGNNAFGIDIFGKAQIDGSLFMFRMGNSPSINVRPGGGASFGPTSNLITATDLDKAALTPSTVLMQLDKDDTVDIAAGAKITPIFLNLYSLGLGQSREDTFLQILPGGTGTITGDFITDFSSVTVAVKGYKKADAKSYYLRTTRIMTPDLAVNGLYDGINAKKLFGAMKFATADSPLGRIFWGIDGLTLSEFPYYVNDAQLLLTYHDGTGLVTSTLHQSDITADNLYGNIGKLAKWFYVLPTTIIMVSSPIGLASLQDSCAPRNHFWLSPLYQQSMHVEAGNHEFFDSQEKFGGAVMGYARGWDKLVLGGQFHYLHGKTESITASTSSDFYGINLGGRYHNFVAPSRSFKPFIDFSAGYSYGDYDMDRLDYSGLINNSSPHAHVYRAGLYLGSDYTFCENRVRLSPKTGIEYAHIRQTSFDESGWSPYLLSIDGTRFNSLRFKSGLDAEFQITNKLSATGAAYYKYECLDRNVNLRSQFQYAPSVAFDTEGYERNRVSGEIGAGLSYQATERISLSAGYNLYLEDKYLAHQVNASFGINF